MRKMDPKKNSIVAWGTYVKKKSLLYIYIYLFPPGNLSPVEISMTIVGAMLGVVIIVALVILILFSANRRDNKKKETKDQKM